MSFSASFRHYNAAARRRLDGGQLPPHFCKQVSWVTGCSDRGVWLRAIPAIAKSCGLAIIVHSKVALIDDACSTSARRT
jgi:hypothetical protein